MGVGWLRGRGTLGLEGHPPPAHNWFPFPLLSILLAPSPSPPHFILGCGSVSTGRIFTGTMTAELQGLRSGGHLVERGVTITQSPSFFLIPMIIHCFMINEERKRSELPACLPLRIRPHY